MQRRGGKVRFRIKERRCGSDGHISDLDRNQRLAGNIETERQRSFRWAGDLTEHY